MFRSEYVLKVTGVFFLDTHTLVCDFLHEPSVLSALSFQEERHDVVPVERLPMPLSASPVGLAKVMSVRRLSHETAVKTAVEVTLNLSVCQRNAFTFCLSMPLSLRFNKRYATDCKGQSLFLSSKF